jgi:hypothetical protein
MVWVTDPHHRFGVREEAFSRPLYVSLRAGGPLGLGSEGAAPGGAGRRR